MWVTRTNGGEHGQPELRGNVASFFFYLSHMISSSKVLVDPCAAIGARENSVRGYEEDMQMAASH